MASQGPLSRALAAALRDAPLLPRDAGAKALARKYAAAIDEAATLAADLDAVPYEENTYKRVAALAAKVEAQTVLDTLGPKLLAVLVQLGMTPAGRGAKGGDSGASIASKLDEFTARRARKNAS